METTYRMSERGGFFTFFWTVFLTTALAVLVTWLCGAYVYDFARPGYVLPAAAMFSLDAAARLIFGFSLYLTLKSSEREGASPTARTASITLWIIAYAMSIMLLPALFVLKWQLFSFIWMLGIIGVTTAQFIVNFYVSIGSAVTVLPYWAMVIYGAVICFMLI